MTATTIFKGDRVLNQYGMPYMGSKSTIAEDIMAIMPRGKRFVVLRGGVRYAEGRN